MELKHFYTDLATNEQIETELPRAFKPDDFRIELNKQDNDGKKLMYLGEQEERIAIEAKKIDNMLQDVYNGVTHALELLIGKFCNHEFGICNIKLPRSRVGSDGSLLDENGYPIEKYGIKQLESEEQRKRLLREVELARKYLPHIEMTEIKSADGKTYALVTGADAKEFNAVIKAVREHRLLVREAQLVAEEKKNLMEIMGLNTETKIVSHGTSIQLPNVTTPAAVEKAVLEMA